MEGLGFELKQGRQDSNLQPPVLETGALPVELLPSVASPVYSPRRASPLDSTLVARRPPRRSLGALFLVLAAAFAGVAYTAGRAASGGAARWVIAVAAALLALWLAGLAFRAWRAS